MNPFVFCLLQYQAWGMFRPSNVYKQSEDCPPCIVGVFCVPCYVIPIQGNPVENQAIQIPAASPPMPITQSMAYSNQGTMQPWYNLATPFTQQTHMLPQALPMPLVQPLEINPPIPAPIKLIPQNQCRDHLCRVRFSRRRTARRSGDRDNDLVIQVPSP
jgi:hypothetical protein